MNKVIIKTFILSSILLFFIQTGAQNHKLINTDNLILYKPIQPIIIKANDNQYFTTQVFYFFKMR